MEPRLAFRNCGIYGQRTDEIVARLDNSARDADILVVQGGINDIAQGRSVEDAAGLIAELAHDESVPLLPFHDTLEDPDRTGRMRADWTSDGDHPSVEGYRRLGEVAARLADYSS